MNSKRVFVTGLGVISPNGMTVKEFWDNCLDGVSGVDTIQKFDVDVFPVKFGAEIKDFDPLNYMSKKIASKSDIFVHYGLAAVKELMEDTGLSREKIESMDRTRIGMLLGTGIGGIRWYTDTAISLDDRGWRRVSPFFIPAVITNMASGIVAMEWGLMGPNFSISTACATANHSILESMHIIKRGEADIMICGGTEAAISPLGLAGFCAARALSTRNDDPKTASRPFDLGRDGFVMGEGAGVLILESEESAIKRGAKIYGEVLGGGMSCDAYHITAPRPDGLGVINCMEQALRNSNIKREDVDYINTHGTSTLLGDKAEQNAIKKVFGKHSTKLKVNSTKSLIGHLLGAAGGVEAIAVLKSMEMSKLHPTINQIDPDPECDLDCVPNKAIDFKVNVALSNSFGFGGHNCTLAFKNCKD